MWHLKMAINISSVTFLRMNLMSHVISVFNYESWSWKLSLLNAGIGRASSKRSSSPSSMLARESSNATIFAGHFEDSGLIKTVGQGNGWRGGWQTSGGQSVRHSRSDLLSSLLQKSLTKLDILLTICIFIQDEAKVTVRESLEWQVLLIFNLLNILGNAEWLKHGEQVSTFTVSGVHFDFKDEVWSGALSFKPSFLRKELS